MTHTEELHARFDGAIDPVLLKAAGDLDRIEARRTRPAVRVRVKAWKAPGIVDRMAAAMVRIRAARGDCTRHDLAQAGFTPAEIDAHGPAATAEAAKRWAAAHTHTIGEAA